MKKSLLFVFAVFTFMFIGISSVSAATTITQADFDAAKADPGNAHNGITYNSLNYTLADNEDFIIGENIDFGTSGVILNNSSIDLNGKTIKRSSGASLFSITDKTVTLKGTGTIDGGVFTRKGSLTIDGSIEFKDTVVFTAAPGSSVTGVINGGTFKGGVEATRANFTVNNGTFIEKSNSFVSLALTESTTTIKNGTFTGVNAGALTILSGNTTIEGGTFTTEFEAGLLTQYNPNSTDAPVVTIKGGTFTGKDSGFTAYVPTTLKLSGGTFKATTTGNDHGALRINANFADLLETGYKYSVASTTTTGVYSTNEVSVISESTTPTQTTTPATTKEAKVSNPKTGDNVLLYVVMLGLSVIGLLGAGIYTKKRFN